MKQEISAVFESGDFAVIVRLMDKHFGMSNYSLKDLFADEQEYEELLSSALRHKGTVWN